MPRPLSVVVTMHALTRARDRAGVSEKAIMAHVAAAITDGRKSVREPAWATRPDMARQRADRTKHHGAKRGELRWVWDEQETVAYLIRVYRDHVLVITSIDRRSAA